MSNSIAFNSKEKQNVPNKKRKSYSIFEAPGTRTDQLKRIMVQMKVHGVRESRQDLLASRDSALALLKRVSSSSLPILLELTTLAR